ncbi:MAG: PQQ-dependent sugar dehydrogenase [Crenarchaeota archaeon]|nr:MAG: PQQ-dependent sugar dehydrogenase [Thermoproteota archaeon]RDJ33432.1 MAG: PQQ-dependent sugar dehydrogenase [Thermoproteota archaeon]RDJ35851.1 MAG: PQQ-dependent sugar dehydrogenase [Thermoproteota archaeon]RDJ36581.1 MAG: PQQ-dependent sugar dehydrogenase [Thermoproteota archaeon]
MNGIFLIFAALLIVIIPTSYAQEFPEYGVKVETVAENLEVPWAIAFAPDDRVFFTERVGKVRVIEDGVLNSEPVLTLNVAGTEGGLLGIALDPNFSENHYVYLYYTYNDFLNTYNKVVRYTESDNILYDEFILLDKIPGAPWHDGGRIKFGPDGKLYVTLGDASDYSRSQKMDSLAGKILRINSDGSVPEDNPFEDSLIYSLGHRNPQGLDWDSSGNLVATEHGPSGERGFAHDEVNVIEPGKNYGWPEIVGDEADEKFVSPILHTGDETWAPSGAAFYKSDKISEWSEKFFVATLRGVHLRMIDFDLQNNAVLSSEALFSGEFGRLRDASVGPDGHLYILTSNRDGRGGPAVNDDRILRIVPIVEKTSVEQVATPKKQMDSGVDPHMIQCNEGRKLIFKANGWVPACVKTSSYQKLIDIGWAADHHPDDHMINMSK